MNYTVSELGNMSSREFLSAVWGNDVLDAIDAVEHIPMTLKEFLDHCVACGGNWGGMLLTGINDLYPSVYNAIPDNMGCFAWRCLCEVLVLLGVDTESADA